MAVKQKNGFFAIVSNILYYGLILIFLTVLLQVLFGKFSENAVHAKFAPIIPPFAAILLAYITKEVIFSLFIGIWLGSLLVLDWSGLSGFTGALASSFVRSVDSYLVNSITNADHARVILFSLGIGGLVGIITRSGGVGGMLKVIAHLITTRRSGQIAAWISGLLVFFDDYASCLIAGNIMRPITDRVRISREKLSFILDSTAAPVACVALISTWIGYEISQIAEGLSKANYTFNGQPYNAYIMFIECIPYKFYTLFMLSFVFFIAYLMKDFGPMYDAEVRAATTGKLIADGAEPLVSGEDLKKDEVPEEFHRWYNAAIPIAFLVIFTILGLYFSGYYSLTEQALKPENVGSLKSRGVYLEGQKLVAPFREILGASSSFSVLMWSSYTSCLIAIALVLIQGIMSIKQVFMAWFDGVKSMMMAIVILILAWSLSSVCGELKTGEFVANYARELISPLFLPTTVFILCSIISFATGSSWLTMSIMMPLAIQSALKIAQLSSFDQNATHHLLVISAGTVLAGSIFGDHCSPISDTTIMSSMAAGSDHIDHVRTQLPYALTVAAISIILGTLPAAMGISAVILLPLGTGTIYLIISKFGRTIENIEEKTSSEK